MSQNNPTSSGSGGKSVSELKRWLETFGQKNKEHFELNQVGVTRAKSIQRRIEKFEKPAATTLTTTTTSGPGLVSSMVAAVEEQVISRNSSFVDPEHSGTSSVSVSSMIAAVEQCT